MVADSAKQLGDVGLFERPGFAVLPYDGDGSGRLGQTSRGAHAPGLPVVGRQGKAALTASAMVRLAVVHQAGEFARRAGTSPAVRSMIWKAPA